MMWLLAHRSLIVRGVASSTPVEDMVLSPLHGNSIVTLAGQRYLYQRNIKLLNAGVGWNFEVRRLPIQSLLLAFDVRYICIILD